MEAIETERYDFRDKEKLSDRLLVEMEELSNPQRIEAYEAVQKIRSDTEENAAREHTEWFNAAVLPLLKDCAANTFAELVLEREEVGIITATLRSSDGFCLQNTDCRLRMAIFMAAQIIFDADGSEAVLALTYDCRR